MKSESFLLTLRFRCIVSLAPVCWRQCTTYLRLTDMKLGYLLNFGEALMKDDITRTVNRLDFE